MARLPSRLSSPPALAERLLPARSELELYRRTRLHGHQAVLCCAPECLLLPGGAHVGRAAMAVLPDEPFTGVAGGEGPDGVAHVVDGPEDGGVHDLLLRGSEEPL